MLAQKTQELADKARSTAQSARGRQGRGRHGEDQRPVTPDGQVPDLGQVASSAPQVFEMKPGEISQPVTWGRRARWWQLLEKRSPTDAEFDADEGPDQGTACWSASAAKPKKYSWPRCKRSWKRKAASSSTRRRLRRWPAPPTGSSDRGIHGSGRSTASRIFSSPMQLSAVHSGSWKPSFHRNRKTPRLMPRQRSSAGILLHPTSLPGHGGIGDLGPAAYEFVDFLAAARQGLWQILPLNPGGYGKFSVLFDLGICRQRAAHQPGAAGRARHDLP